MQRLSAYRFELKINGAQRRQCVQFAGVKRYADQFHKEGWRNIISDARNAFGYLRLSIMGR